MEYTGTKINSSMNQMATSADGMRKNLTDIKNMSSNIWKQANNVKDMIRDGKWDNTIKDLVTMLDNAANQSGVIRKDLERISVDLNKLKSEIEYMVLDANNKYNQRLVEMDNAIAAENRRVHENRHCFTNAMKGFLTIITLGTTCVIQDQELKKMKSRRDNLIRTKSSFQGDVGSQLKQLDGLNVAAVRLYSESLDKSKVVRTMRKSSSSNTKSSIRKKTREEFS